MRPIALGMLLLIASLASAQDRKKEAPARGYPGVDPKRVDEAIRKGMDCLKKARRTLDVISVDPFKK